MLQDKILNDLKTTRNNDIKDALKIIMQELQREKDKILSDKQVVAVLNKLRKYEEERLSKCKQKMSTYYATIITYLPKQVSDEELKDYIKDNIDLSLKQTQIIGLVKKHFGNSVYGDKVKEVLENYL